MTDPYQIFFGEFLDSTESLVERLGGELPALGAGRSEPEALSAVLRGLHSLKGNSSFVPDCPITPLAHAAEEAVEAVRDGRVAADRLLGPLAEALDCVRVRLAEYRRLGTPERGGAGGGAEGSAEGAEGSAEGAAGSREAAIAAALRMLARSSGASEIARPHYLYGTEDVTEIIEHLAWLETSGGPGADRGEHVEAMRVRIAGLARAAGDSELADVAAPAGGAASRDLLRVLARRVERVPTSRMAPASALTASALTASALTASALAASALTAAPAPGRPPAPAEHPAPVPPSFRVDGKQVDDFLEYAGELHLVADRLAQLGSSLRELEARATPLERRRGLDRFAAGFRAVLAMFDPLAGRLERSLLDIRRVPARQLLTRHESMARELGRRLGKEVDVAVEGRDTRVDKSILEKLDAPLTHLVRNALDHGLESPEDRLAAGKPQRGTVFLQAVRDGEHVLLEVGDDGRGIDVAAVRRAAVERGVLSEQQAARLSDADAIRLVYRPGISSRRTATELSGRGYGLDEVETAVRRMRGTIHVASDPGRGTRFRLRIPDAGLGIVPCIRVRVGKRSFLIPREATRLWTHGEVDPETGGPFVDLAALLDALEGGGVPPESSPDQGGACPLKVVLESDGRRLVVGIDEVGQEEGIVARPLPRELTRAPLWSMAAVRGNQDIELVLDVAGLADHVQAGMTAASERSGE